MRCRVKKLTRNEADQKIIVSRRRLSCGCRVRRCSSLKGVCLKSRSIERYGWDSKRTRRGGVLFKIPGWQSLYARLIETFASGGAGDTDDGPELG